MALDILAVHQAAQSLLACVCESLDAIPTEVPGLAGCPCRACVVPGQPAADGCDGGCNLPAGAWPGQLTVNTVRVFASDRTSFPREVVAVRDLRQCAMPQLTVAELAVTVWRCSPIPNDAGCPPSCEELELAAKQVHADIMAVQRGVLCCFAATAPGRHGQRYVMGASTLLGPQGGCAGFQTRVIAALDGSVGPLPTAALGAADGLPEGA